MTKDRPSKLTIPPEELFPIIGLDDLDLGDVMASDLSVEVFKVLRNAFFDEHGKALEFPLRPKRNTQDDPFDQHVIGLLAERLPDDISCVSAPGPLVSPDMALVRERAARELPAEKLRADATAAIGLEVKKLERGPNGQIARASGLDYNSTPPCGTIRVYDAAGKSVDIRGFYLFVCLENGSTEGRFRLSALALCDGDVLNADFKYYIDITGERSKDIGVGTYGDGANRNRPMVIFANPLGANSLDRAITLVHTSDELADNEIVRAGSIQRTIAVTGHPAVFTCYRDVRDFRSDFDKLDPFPNAKKRSERTSGRGRFNLGFRR